jgi:rubredoxin
VLSSSPAGERSTPIRAAYRPLGCPLSSAAVTEAATKQLYVCTSCGFIYDPDEGDPDGGIPPGTAFEDIPSDWFCPVCGARKQDFEPHDA